MFPVPKKYVAISRSPYTGDRSVLYTPWKEYGRLTGLCWLMSPEPAPPAQLPIPTIKEILYTEDFLQAIGAQQQLDVLVRKAKITEVDPLRVSQKTCGSTRQLNLAPCKTRRAHCKQFCGVPSSCLKGQAFAS